MQNHRNLLAALSLLALALVIHACSGSEVVGPPDPPAAAPTADFQVSDTQGVAPFTATFNDVSNGATSWLWDFGDGRVSSEQHPVHEFAAPGTYTVRLTVDGPTGTDMEEKADLIQADPAVLDPGFELAASGTEPSGGWVPFTGNLGGASNHVVRSLASAPTSLIDNGMPSAGFQWLEVSSSSTNNTVPPPSTTDDEGGAPTVGGAGVSQVIHYSTTHPVLQLEASFVNGESFLSSFNDWMSIDVSDGTTTHNLYSRDTTDGLIGPSNIHGGGDVTPVETVTANLAELFPGSSEATPLTLTVQVGNGTDADVDSFGYVDNLRLVAPPVAAVAVDFLVSQRTGGIGTPFGFSDQSAGEPKSWVWDFGDGSVSLDQDPDHDYAAEGTFDVRLRASTPGSGDVLTKTGFVMVDNSACETAALQVLGGECRGTGETITFQNDSQNGTSFLWNFGDGTTFPANGIPTASAANVTHAYGSPGDYTVTLTTGGPCFGAVEPPPAQVTDEVDMDIVDAPVAGDISISITFPSGTAVSCSSAGYSFHHAAAFKDESVRFTATNNNPVDAPITSFSWQVISGGASPNSGSASQFTTAFTAATAGNVFKTVRLTASNCAGSVQIDRTIKVVQTFTTVYASMAGCTSCHDNTNVLNMSTKATAHGELRNVDMESCGSMKRVSIACGGSTNASLSGLRWALSNNVCGDGIMSENCGCLDPVDDAAQVLELEDWINFGSPNN